ncbi:MAG: monovalent cation:proton antiporter-2 (CPA2) family protein [Litorimonas sp.]
MARPDPYAVSMDGSLLFSAFIFLCAAALLVPVSKLTGLGSVIGYLVAGVLIGPSVLGLISDPMTILHFAEFGVVMMLFLIGMELEPRKLWAMRGKLMGLGGSQVLLTLLAIAGAALVFGLSTGEALAVGMALSLSSTAMALQILQQRRLMAEPEGQGGFSVLLFQDVIVIAMIAAMPLLATMTPFEGVSGDYGDHGGEAHGPTGIWLGVTTIGVFVGMFLGGRYLLAPLFRMIARANVRETFTAIALLLVVGAALLMNWLGLSPALGAFIAGMVLADSEYRHQLERDIEPFKALLLGLFFISVGMSLDLAFIATQPGLVIGLVLGLMGLKFAILYLIATLAKFEQPRRLFFSALLCQSGEFGFVIFTFATTEGAIRPETAAILTAVIALSMALTPLILLLFDRMILPRFQTGSTTTGEAPFDQHRPVLILGYGRIGQIIGRLLEAQGIKTTLIDNDGDHIEFLKQFHHRVFYGDGSDMDLLRQAGADNACIIVVTIKDNLQVVREIKETFPHAKIVARAKGRVELFDLLAEEVHFAERETVRGALALGEAVLTDMGYNEEEAEMLAQRFLELDYENIQQTYHMRGDLKALAEHANEARELLRETLETELQQRRES